MKTLTEHIKSTIITQKNLNESVEKIALSDCVITVTGKMFMYLHDNKKSCKKIEIGTYGSFDSIDVNEKNGTIGLPIFETEDYATISIDGKPVDDAKITLTYFADTDAFYVSDEHIHGATSAEKYSNIYSKVETVHFSDRKTSKKVYDAIKSLNAETKHK